MEILREMVQVLTKYKTKQIEVLGNPTDNPSKVHEFYEAIANGTFKTDEEAAAHFFDGDVRNQSYKNLKSRLKNRLVNTVFFIEANDSMFNEYEKAYLNCYKDWAAAKIFMGKSAKNAGVNICTKVLKQAIKADFTDIVIEVSRNLRQFYGAIGYYKRKFEYYNDLLKEYLIIREKELLIEEYYLRLTSYFLLGKSLDSDLIKDANQYSMLIKDDLNAYNTFNILLAGGMIEIIKLMGVNNYKDTAEFCQKIILRFEAKPVIWRSGLATFFFQKIVCHTQLKEFEKGRVSVETMFKYLEVGTFNWFKGQELYMYLLLYTKNYQDSFKLFGQVTKNKRYEFLPNRIKEKWQIFKAYIYLLIEVDFITINKDDKLFTKFKLGKFLNEVPTFSQDKRGINISILSLQIIFTIIQKKYNRAIDRIEAIEKYTSRYLKKDTNFRSNCFIKMLLEIPKEGFHRVAVERKAKKYRQRIEEMPIEVANQSHSIEIIPYEELWEIVLNILDTKRVSRKN